MELARCDQVERHENGSIPWKCARECRRAANLGQGNSDAKKTDIKEKTSDTPQEESQKKTGEIEGQTREMSPT